MKTLIFEGAGWEKAESSIKSGVGNCRIRTRIRNNKGRLIYLEMTGFLKSSNDKREILNGLSCVGHVSHCFYADSKWDSCRNYSEDLKEVEIGHFEYSKESILKLVNEKLDCSFDDMEVVNDNSVRVHDTEDHLCNCSNGDCDEYKDIEVNINMLDRVEPFHEYPSSRMAQYSISYDFVKGHKRINKWMSDRTQKEQDQFPNNNYYIALRWDENGIITSAELSARQNFCSFGLSIDSLIPITNEILKIKNTIKDSIAV